MVTIDRLSMDFKMDRLEFAKELYGAWESFCRYSVEKVIDETISPFNHDHEVIEIEELDIEIGNVAETEFFKKFPLLFRQKLHEQFTRLLHHDDYAKRGKIRIRPLRSALLETWIFFLLNGYIPSDFYELFRNPVQAFETLMDDNPRSVIEALQNEWHHTRFGRRLTEQLKDEQLIRIIEEEEPEQSVFIARFIRSTQPLRLDTGSKSGSSSGYRSVLWITTYSFLFFNQQSIFSRKEYLRYTVRELTAHFNLNFNDTLLLLHACFNKIEGETTASIIRGILEELIEEGKDATKEEEKKQTEPVTFTSKDSNFFQERAKNWMKHFTVALEKEFPNQGFSVQAFEKLHRLAQLIENEYNPLSIGETAFIEKIRNILLEISWLLKLDLRDLVILFQESIPVGEKYHFVPIINNLRQYESERKDQQTDNQGIVFTSNTKMEAKGEIPGIVSTEVPRKSTIDISEKSTKEVPRKNPIEITEKKSIEAPEKSPIEIPRKSSIDNPEKSSIMVENAGLVLLSPYLQRLFSILQLTQANKFTDVDAQVKAIFLLQELLFCKKTEYYEHELFLNKLLVGYTNNTVVLPLSVPLNEKETSTCESLLKGCMDNWPVLKNTSVESFCESFIRRNGKLERKETYWSLKVEEMSFDILLDKLPWSYSPIKYPWMTTPIFVQWR